MLTFVYDPAIVTNPQAVAGPLGIGVLIAGVPERYTGYVLPPAGWVVLRETWAGPDVLLPQIGRAHV